MRKYYFPDEISNTQLKSGVMKNILALMTANVRTVGTAKDHCSVYITLNLNIIKYPAIHTNYIISHATTLPYNHII